MQRTELNISFSQKDAAKACARQHNTRIMWDASKKVWYWEGEAKDLPDCLKQYHPASVKAQQEAKEAARIAAEEERNAERNQAKALEAKGDLESLLQAYEITKICYYNCGYDGEGEIYRHNDLQRLAEKIEAAKAADTVAKAGGNETAQAVASHIVKSSINAKKAAAQAEINAKVAAQHKAFKKTEDVKFRQDTLCCT